MGERRRPPTIIIAAILLAVCAGCAITFGVLTARQIGPFAARVGAIDPLGPETDEWINMTTASLWVIAIAGFITAVILLLLAVALLRPVYQTAARGRWIATISVAAVATIVTVYSAISGGIGFHLDAVPTHYDGDNMVVLRLPHAYQASVVRLDVVAATLLAAVIVLMAVSMTAKYFLSVRSGFTVDPYADFLRRQRDESASREDHAG